VGSQARLMSAALRKLSSAISKGNTVAIFINQLRQKIGVVYGNPETTTGGLALKYFASVRIDIRKGEILKNGAEAIGARTRAKIVKNKVAPPFKDTEFDIMYGTGISRTGELVDIGAKMGIVEKSGSWFAYNGTKIGQGRDNAKEFLKNNPKIADEIQDKIMAAVMASREVKEPEEEEKPAPKAAPKAAKPADDGILDVDITADDFN
ncbi:MAG: DNA recombination/repair protein RecA, partial [Clostridia bacterium]|nr:DNA recombination/repair protein RecA [Clostridia bacterium]